MSAGGFDIRFDIPVGTMTTDTLTIGFVSGKDFSEVAWAGEFPNLLVLKTTVEKYTPGSETRRAVTTVSGATKLTVRSQLLTREGKVVFERSVNGNVRFFGSNLRATHNLAHNIAKTITQSSWSGPWQPTAILTGEL